VNRYRWPIALMVLASALAVALLVPASALAAKPSPTSFTAPGTIWIAEWGNQKIKGPMGIAKGEQVDFLIGDRDGWDALDGAYAVTYHNGTIRYLPDGTFQGRLSGKFVMAGFNETGTPTGTLEGNMVGEVSGTWNPLDPTNPTGTTISDRGTWQSTKGTGVFAKVKAGGTWEADLEWGEFQPGVWTYFGTTTFKGTYQ